MITYVRGSLFESPAKTLVNTVNTVGVMGKGIAKTFKQVYPEMFNKYQQLCERGQFQMGKLWLYKTDHKWILNFPTKVHWRQPSKVEYVDAGLKAFVASYANHGITSVAFPMLGCGNGELDWRTQVQPLMISRLGNLAIDVFIHEYAGEYGPPEHKEIELMTAWLRSEPRALAFAEMWADLIDLVGDELTLRSWDDATDFRVTVTDNPEEGLRIRPGAGRLPGLIANLLNKVVPARLRPRILGSDVFVPQEAFLDLWQSIRAYGFCVPRIMPAGLDVLAPFVLALLAKLKYMKSVELSVQSRRSPNVITERGLQLFAAPLGSPIVHEPAQQAYAVHPA